MRLACLAIGLAVWLPAFSVAAAQKPDKEPAPAREAEPPAPTDYAHPEGLISNSTLKEWLDTHQPKLVLVDARAEERFAQGHLPGAHNIQSDLLMDPQAPPYFLPSHDALKALCAGAGINTDSRVVVYDEDDGRLAARVWFTLHAYGHAHVSILDGGLGLWKDAPLTKATGPGPKPGNFEPAGKLRGVCRFDELKEFTTHVQTLGKLPPLTLLDARSPAEYMGEELRGNVGGHIPSAGNLDWSGVLRGTVGARVWRTAPEIHALLRLAGVERGKKLAVYDQAGNRSAHLYFTLWLMGYDQVFNYCGGWRDYSGRAEVEIER